MFLTSNWFWRGFQSAIFYYVSCAPFSKLSYRRKRRKEYKRAKAEKALNEAEGGLYEHPSPFSTNPYWKEEIVVGPGPPARKAVRDGKGKPENGKGGKGRRLQTGGVGSSTDTGTSSADTVVGDEGTRDSEEGWNKRRYQREDEMLWGLGQQDTSSVGMAPVSRPGSSSPYQYYARNPAINDLHPPVVSTHPKSKTETQWMLQPPPKAKVMEGKERANTPNRSRSTSGGSYRSRGTVKKVSDMSLGRQVGERLMESKFKQSNPSIAAEPSTPVSRGPSGRSDRSATPIAPPGQSHDRDAISSSTRRSNSENRKQPPPPISIDSELPLPSPPTHRPPLSTIPSETLPQRQKDGPPHLRPVLLAANSASSLHILQELAAPSSQLNAIKAASTTLPNEAVRTKLPPPSHQEDADLKLPEVESWFPEGGWSFPPQARENERAHHRLSMSI